MRRRHLYLFILISVLALLLVACGGGTAAPTEPPAGIARTAKGIAEGLVREGADLFDPELYRRYFRQLYGLSDRDKHEIQALRFWDGDPAVRLLEADDDLNAMLLERCQPGTVLRHPRELLGLLRQRPG